MNAKLKGYGVLLAAFMLSWAGSMQSLLAAETDSAEQSPAPDKEEKWGKVLPLPIFITEPAIGEGLGAALIYFHDEKKDDGLNVTTGRELGKVGIRSKPPPTATGVFGAKTNDGTAVVGIGHSNSFMDDRFRLLGATADARIKSQLYLSDQSFDFTFDGVLLFVDMETRLGDSDVFFGITTSYTDADIDFKTELDEFDNADLKDFSFVDVGLAASLIYDTRDNTLMPASGFIADLTSWVYDGALGGDFDYRKHSFKGNAYYAFAENYVLGLRLDLISAYGDVPFYAEPYVQLRGIPALRYQGEVAGSTELELRRRLGESWSVSVFGGSGSTEVREDRTETRNDIKTVGFGLRYLALKEQDAWVGLDIAEGPEDTVWYIQMGNAW
jgi:hypothetical protein